MATGRRSYLATGLAWLRARLQPEADPALSADHDPDADWWTDPEWNREGLLPGPQPEGRPEADRDRTELVSTPPLHDPLVHVLGLLSGRRFSLPGRRRGE